MKCLLILLCILVPLCSSTSADNNVRLRRQSQQQQNYQNYQQPQPNYRPYSQAPASIKQLLAFQQAREPLVNIPPQKPPNLGPAQPIQPVQTTQNHASSSYQPQIQYGAAPQQPNYQNQAAAFANQYRPQQQQQQQQQPQQQQYAPQPQQYQQG